MFLICILVFGSFSNAFASNSRIDELYKNFTIIEKSDLPEDDINYWVKLEVPNDYRKKTIKLNDDTENYDNTIYKNKIIIDGTRQTTNNTYYNVYSSYGTLKYSNLASLFDAIGKASSTGDYVCETAGSNQTVFTKNNSTSTFYKFQFTYYYGTTTSVSDAQNWVDYYAYAHVYDGTGRLAYNSYNSIKGTPASYSLEPESGGYYYKYGYAWNGNRSSYNKINFTNSSLKFGSSGNNAYIYSAVVSSSQTIELGIMTSNTHSGNWCLFKNDETGFVSYPNKIAMTSTLTNGVYYASGNVEIKLAVSNGGATGIVYSNNLSIADGTTTLTGSSFSENMTGACTFLQAISLVPANINITSDLRNGAYMRGISFNSCKLYNNTTYTGTPYAFYGDSTDTYIAFMYNDDVASYTRNSNTKESFDIDYTIDYN